MKKLIILPVLVSLLASSLLASCNDNTPSSSGVNNSGSNSGVVTPSNTVLPSEPPIESLHNLGEYIIEGNTHYQKCMDEGCDFQTEKKAHVYDQEVAVPDAFISVATCSSAAKFYLSCACGVISDTETFEHGEKMTHDGSSDYLSNATEHWKVCSICEETHSKEAHSLLTVERATPTCLEPAGKYNECSLCGWKTPDDQITGYAPALGHQLSDTFTTKTQPSSAREGVLSLACNRQGCDISTDVNIPTATAESYTITSGATETTLKLKSEAINSVVTANPEIKDLASKLNNVVIKITNDKIGLPYKFEVNGIQILPEVPSTVDTELNNMTVVLKLNVGDELKIRGENGEVINFVQQDGEFFHGSSYVSTQNIEVKLYLSKNGGIYSEILKVESFKSYSIKVNGTLVSDASVTPSDNNFAQFEVELKKEDVVTFFGDTTALKGGIVEDASTGYKALLDGVHTFYINNRNEIYVKAPELENALSFTIYYYNTLGWENVNYYAWYTSGGKEETLSAWPGKPMSAVDGKENWYSVTMELKNPAEIFEIIFNDGTNQTKDITVFEGIDNIDEGYYFFGKDITPYSSYEAAKEAADNYVAPVATPWGLVGIAGDWNNDIYLQETVASSGIFEATVTVSANTTFKIRKDGKWDENYGADALASGSLGSAAPSDGNILLSTAGTYKISFDTNTKKITITLAG